MVPIKSDQVITGSNHGTGDPKVTLQAGGDAGKKGQCHRVTPYSRRSF
jgi:hypothetical protein